MKDKPGLKKMLRLVFFWSAALMPAAILLAVLCGEIYLRHRFQAFSDEPLEREQLYLPDAKVGWRNRPIPGLTNSQGFRNDEEFTLGKSGKRRIMFLGDSILFSYFFTKNELGLTDWLEQIAEDEGIQMEFMNISSPGYSTYQELVLLREHMETYRPDQVVVAYCLNDTYPTENPFLNLAPMYAHWQLDNPTREAISNPTEKSVSALLVFRWFQQYWPRIKRGLFRAVEKDIAQRFYDGNQSPGVQHFVVLEDLRAMKAFSGEYHARFSLVIYPRSQEIVERKRLKDTPFLLKHLGGEMEIHDLYPIFNRRYNKGNLDFLTDDDAHPNHTGQKLVADYLFPFLID